MPLFFTQGFLEWNTEAISMQTYLENHAGEQRGWLGQWDHVRGNDRAADGTLLMGRDGWFEEVMAFYDEKLKGVAPTTEYPNFSVQDSTGTWRAETDWLAAGQPVRIDLGAGSYVDDGVEFGAAAAERSSWSTRSQPLTQATRVTGTPRLTLEARGRGDVMARLFDVAPDGTSVMFDEQVSELAVGQTVLDLRSTDWLLPAGHSLAVQVGTIQPGGDFRAEDWLASPSGETITIDAARLDLALDDPTDDVAIPGHRPARLDEYLSIYTSQLPAAPASFTVPTAGT